MLQNRHSMAPMRREHAEIRRLVAEFSRLTKTLGDERPHIGRTVAVRRVLYQLYALLEIHLVEEEVFIPIVEPRRVRRGGRGDGGGAEALGHPGGLTRYPDRARPRPGERAIRPLSSGGR